MATSFFLLMLQWNAPQPIAWRWLDSEIFRPFPKDFVTVAPDHRVYVLNPDNFTITRISPSGTVAGVFAGRGQGPGEFLSPTFMSVLGDRLYVVESAGISAFIHSFDRDGKFLGKRTVPGEYLRPRIFPVTSGWIVVDRFGDQQIRGEGGIRHYSKDFKTHSTLMTFPRVQVGVVKEPPCEMSFDPVAQHLLVSVDAEGRQVAMLEPGSAEILLYDAATKEVIRRLKPPVKRIPLNEDWAEALFQEEKSYWEPCSLRRDFPKIFPPISFVKFSPGGHLCYVTWPADPDNEPWGIHFVDTEGNPVEPWKDLRQYSRIFSIRGEWALVQLFDPQSENYGLGFTRLAQLEEYLQETSYVK